MKSVLLVVDIQPAFRENDAATIQSFEKAIEYISAAIALFREKHRPVIV